MDSGIRRDGIVDLIPLYMFWVDFLLISGNHA
jgi:hypothetical protein